MRVALTGASGYVGRHVLEVLAKRSVNILAATRCASKLDAWRGKAEIVELDMGDAPSRQLDGIAQCDTLIHLAWEGLPHYESRRHFETELPRQYRFLKALVERGMPAMLIAGTCLEYGLQCGELSEECPAQPASPYGLAKDTLRRQMEFLRHGYSFAMTWARLFYSYGEGQSSTSLYAQLHSAVSRGDRSFDMSGGEQLRDYLPIAEAARVIVDLAMRRANDGVVNVCSGQPMSVRRLVEKWIQESRFDIRLNLGRYPYPDYEPFAFWGARGKLDKLLAEP